MSLRRLLPTTRNAEAARNPLENDRTPTYTSNNTIHTDSSVPGRDSVMLPDEIESSLTNSLGIAETSEVATPRIGPRYSKRPSGKFNPSTHLCEFVSILPDLC